MIERRDWPLVVGAGAVPLSGLALGGVHVQILCFLALLLVVGLSGPRLFRRVSWSLPLLLLVGLAIYTLLQAVLLPSSAVALLSPRAAEVWTGAARPWGTTLASMSLHLEPVAAPLEALRLLTYAAAFVVAQRLRRRHGEVLVVQIIVWSSLAVALAFFAHSLLPGKAIWGLYTAAPGPGFHTAPLINPNNLAGVLNLGALCCCGLFTRTHERSRKLMWGLGFGLLVAGSVFTGSRGGVGALVLAFLLAPLVVPRRSGTGSRLRGAVGPSLLGALVIVSAIFLDLGVRDALNEQQFIKLQMFPRILPMLRDYWAFGCGRGAFGSVFSAYYEGSPFEFVHAENFVLQWLAEWGLMGVMGLLGFAWCVRPSVFNVRKSRLGAFAWLAVLALGLQNLVDVGFEVPCIPIAIFFLLGGFYPKPAARAEKGRGLPARASIALGVLVLALASYLSRGAMRDSERDVLGAKLERGFQQEAEVSSYHSELRDALSRHPADTFFLRLGAISSLRLAPGSTLPWVNVALGRNLRSGPDHLVLAQDLHRMRARGQALLELRLAAESDSQLLLDVGKSACSWSRDKLELLSVLPTGPDRARARDALMRGCQQASCGLQLAVAQAIASEATADSVDRETGVSTLVNSVRSKSCSAAELLPTAWQILEGSDSRRGKTARDRVLRARLHLASDQSVKALMEFGDGCSDASKPKQCASVWAECAVASGNRSALGQARTQLLAHVQNAQERAKAHERFARWYQRLDDHPSQLHELVAAAQAFPSAARWERVGTMARKSSRRALALRAYRSAQRLDPGRRAALQAKIDGLSSKSLPK